MLNIINRLTRGEAKMEELDELEELCLSVRDGSLCGLGSTAPNPVLTSLRYFREEYEAHTQGICPTGKCQEMISYSINDECIGCTKCVQVCPVNAIEYKPYEKHNIDLELCTKCDSCREICPVEAVIKG